MSPVLMLVIACIATAIVVGGVAAVIAFKQGSNHRKRIAEAEIGGAEAEAQRIKDSAKKDAETQKKEALISAKDEIHKLRAEADREIKERRKEANANDSRSR